MQTAPVVLSEAELIEVTGYRQKARMWKWLERNLRIKAPKRADGLPVVTRAQIDQAVMTGRTIAGPNWSK